MSSGKTRSIVCDFTILLQSRVGGSIIEMIHFITTALGGEGYLNFMGNKFGHPEWIDILREGNNCSYGKCRRQWNLVDTHRLRYKEGRLGGGLKDGRSELNRPYDQFMIAFDRAMNLLHDKFPFLSSTKQIVSSANDEDKDF